MPNDTLIESLSRAYTALHGATKDEIRNLSLIDCTIMLDTLPNNPKIDTLREQLADRLERRLDMTWIRDGDLFEVFSVATTLWQYNQARVTGDTLIYAMRRLIQSEAVVGGPYYSGGTIAIMANLQIGRFVRFVARPLPSIDLLLTNVIASTYHEDTELTYPYAQYMLAPLYSSSKKIDHSIEDHPQTPTYRALGLTIAKSSASISVICDEQQETGWWAGEPLIKDKPGSRMATTALIIGALDKYRRDSTAPLKSTLQLHNQTVIQITKHLFDTLSEPLRSSVLISIDKVCAADKGYEITSLVHLFSQALKEPAHMTNHQCALLGAASVCGWIAYTIYDDFLDDEGIPAQLPIATIAMRTSLDCFRAALPEQDGFQRYVATVFSRMDEANAWEVNECRFIIQGDIVVIGRLPRYGKRSMLATRSFAHALGSIAISMQSEKGTSVATQHIKTAFRHYLIARQLGDDLHDWSDDMRVGHASYVVTDILRTMRIQPGSYNISILLADMQKQFQHTAAIRTCIVALHHINQSRRAFKKSNLLQTTNYVYRFLDTLEGSIRHSLDLYSKAQVIMSIERDHFP